MNRNGRTAKSYDFGTTNVQNRGYSAMSLDSLFPIIETSLEENRVWISDFQNDSIYVPNDLFDVVKAFEHFYGQIRESA